MPCAPLLTRWLFDRKSAMPSIITSSMDPSRNKVLAEYRDLTGAVPLLPRWAYGFWQCRERYSSQQQILDTAAEFRNRKIPVDVLVQDWQYWGKYGWNAMRFDESAYPESDRDDVCLASPGFSYGHLCLGEVRRRDSRRQGNGRRRSGSQKRREHRGARRSERTRELGRSVQSASAEGILVRHRSQSLQRGARWMVARCFRAGRRSL